jgi:hypothetical protein
MTIHAPEYMTCDLHETPHDEHLVLLDVCYSHAIACPPWLLARSDLTVIGFAVLEGVDGRELVAITSIGPVLSVWDVSIQSQRCV